MPEKKVHVFPASGVIACLSGFQNTVRRASKFYNQPPEGLAAAAEAHHQVFRVPQVLADLPPT